MSPDNFQPPGETPQKNRHVKVIVVDPRRTPTAEAADLHLAIRPGTDIDLLNGIAHLLSRWGYIDLSFIDECTTNFLPAPR
jgi:ferredoxin-nitrate reductase